MLAVSEETHRVQGDVTEWSRCFACARPMAGSSRCGSCGESFVDRDGLLHACGPLRGRNRVAAGFYESRAWARFRPWEKLFLWFQGPGQVAARRRILRHLPSVEGARVLEVGVGDGENLGLLPASWEVYGVDVARRMLADCALRYPAMVGRLGWAEAENLPFEEGTFDAVYTVGGFNYFRDHAAALREMKRVVKVGGTVVVADERPDLYTFAPSYALGMEWLDRAGLRLMGLDREFIAMVFETSTDVDAIARREWPGHRCIPIWNRLGYCLVDSREG